MAAPIDHAWALLKAIPTRNRKPSVTGDTYLDDYSYHAGKRAQDAAHFRESLPDFPLGRHEEISHELDRMDAERNEQARSEAMMMAMQRLHEDRALDNASMFELGDAMRSRYTNPLASGHQPGKEHYIERISSTGRPLNREEREFERYGLETFPDAPARTIPPRVGSDMANLDPDSMFPNLYASQHVSPPYDA